MTEEEYEAKIRGLEHEIAALKDKLTAKIKNKKYGLVWEDVPEAFDKETENKIPILEEVKELAVKNNDGKPTHILIEGDNYHALQCLNYTHKGKIDVIYIDPPYNTGKEFVYRDKRMMEKYPNGQTIDSNHPLRHSTWLSFMSKRLRLAKELLSERGVIFISIDDNEQANLKLLCDSVFGEENLVGQFIWKKKQGGGNDSNNMVVEHEYIICYGKAFNYLQLGLDKTYILDDNLYPFSDNKGDYGLITLDKTSIRFSDSLVFPIKDKEGNIYTPRIVNGKQSCWRWSQKKVEEEFDSLVFKKGKVYTKYYKPEGVIAKSLLVDTVYGRTESGNDDISAIFRNPIFKYPKPVSLVKHIISISSKYSNITVLDFFAGSGTTMHATMKLNEEDGGNRQCILVNINENNICRDVTYERNRRVMQGYTNSKGEEVKGLGGSLKYYKTAFVGKNPPADATDEDKIALALKAGHLIAIAENTLDETESTDCFQIFRDGNRYTAIYFSGSLAGMCEFTEKVESIRDRNRLATVNVYIYCRDSVSEFECEFSSLKRIKLHAIPQPIIEIYKQLNA